MKPLTCIDEVLEFKLPCLNDKCRYHLNFSSDLNCAHIAIMKNGAMKLQEVGDRMHLTAARIKQIEQETLKKMSKRSSLLKVLAE